MKRLLWIIFSVIYKFSLFNKKLSRFTAFLIIISSSKLNDHKFKKSAIVLCKNFGIEDIQYGLKSYHQRTNFYSTKRLLFKFLFYKYINKKYIKNYSHYEYQKFLSTNFNDVKSFKAHLNLILFWLKKDFNLKTIFTFNIMNFHEREFLEVCQKNNINLAVSHKECLKSPSTYKIYGDCYINDLDIKNYKNLHIGVYNKMEKEQMIRSNIPPELITIVGCPRVRYNLDNYKIKKNSKISSKKNILVLEIYHQAGLPYLDKKWNSPAKKIDWEKTYYDALNILYQLKIKFPNIDLRFRSKGKKFTNKIFNLYQSNQEYFHFSKSTIVNDFKWADIVIGLNSSSVIEAVAFQKKTIVPSWHENLSFNELNNNGYLFELGDSVIWSKSTIEFKELIRNIILEKFDYPQIRNNDSIAICDKFFNCFSDNQKIKYGEWLSKVTI